MAVILILLTLILAFANGANDVSKGIATLVGAGVANYHRAVIWATITTAAGAMAAAFITQALVKTFSGRGLLAVPETGEAFLLSIACGAIAWLLIATRLGLPVSTTHSLTGSLCGAGIAAATVDGVIWGAILRKAAVPLALSPLISLLIVFALYRPYRRMANRYESSCVCVTTPAAIAVGGGGIAIQSPVAEVVVGKQAECERTTPVVASRTNTIDLLHWLASGATSFFRGLNDTPKILALGVGAAATAGITSWPFYALVAGAMAAGSLLWGFRVTQTLAQKVTPISPSDGFLANAVTSFLVAAASMFALPVSTTQVASGAIIGSGIATGGHQIRWKTVREMIAAWLITLPVSALIAAGAFLLIR